MWLDVWHFCLVSWLVSLWDCDIHAFWLWYWQGAVESVSVGEIKLSLRQSLVKLGVGFISKDPKLQVLICDLEVVVRPSTKSTTKGKSRRSRTAGRGKWMVVASIARFLSVSVTDLVVKVSNAWVFFFWVKAFLLWFFYNTIIHYRTHLCFYFVFHYWYNCLHA